MAHFNVKDLQKSIETLQDIVRCAVCLETVRGEIVQCVNGHLLCSGCKTSLRDCPTCRQRFSTAKPSRTITQVIEALPTRCKHQNCEVYVTSGGDDHEKYCGFRMIHCILCERIVCAKDILKHVKQQHPSCRIFTAEVEEMRLTDFEYGEQGKWIYAFFSHGQFFGE
uniref:RING-type domain-containing protein n=1 Tax=Graphocephala atropunctata TaxID=36148 RepID=A0A1B6M7X1_9HEMI